ncbi:MAG: phytanoyl-CoA dioxygenase family protein, partial [Pseudomonadota bacterium]|nr:phytanoyl-CoA dioxygenase family protein [Pseudomonadota bacterium]
QVMLTRSQTECFNRQGFLVVEDVFSEAQVLGPVRREYQAVLDQLVAEWVAEGRMPGPPADAGFYTKLKLAYQAGCDWFQPLDISLPGDRITSQTPMHFGPAVFDMLTDPGLLDCVECLLGPELTSNPIQHVRLKPPAPMLYQDEVRAHITRTDWHQDRGVAHAEADQTQMVTVWIAVTDASIENGCLQVIPKTADQGLLPHCPKTQTAIADPFIDEARAVPLPVKSGGIVLLDPLVPHSSLPNLTDTFRWSFDIRFNRTGDPTGRSHFPDFIARSRAQPEAELKDWRVWRSMWEEARTHLAAEQHIPIHRWASDAPFCA